MSGARPPEQVEKIGFALHQDSHHVSRVPKPAPIARRQCFAPIAGRRRPQAGPVGRGLLIGLFLDHFAAAMVIRTRLLEVSDDLLSGSIAWTSGPVLPPDRATNLLVEGP
jgi:hypothetical protein